MLNQGLHSDNRENNIDDANIVDDITIEECPACHTKISENDKECPECGLNLR